MRGFNRGKTKGGFLEFRNFGSRVHNLGEKKLKLRFWLEGVNSQKLGTWFDNIRELDVRVHKIWRFEGRIDVKVGFSA